MKNLTLEKSLNFFWWFLYTLGCHFIFATFFHEKVSKYHFLGLKKKFYNFFSSKNTWKFRSYSYTFFKKIIFYFLEGLGKWNPNLWIFVSLKLMLLQMAFKCCVTLSISWTRYHFWRCDHPHFLSTTKVGK